MTIRSLFQNLLRLQYLYTYSIFTVGSSNLLFQMKKAVLQQILLKTIKNNLSRDIGVFLLKKGGNFAVVFSCL